MIETTFQWIKSGVRSGHNDEFCSTIWGIIVTADNAPTSDRMSTFCGVSQVLGIYL